ncbi:hypothetical protein M413DRAFT_427965 [Hebeloma cylindrosporum]|uniref:non-specific serine/threonine protein kinase n=1 Tax=Hebeloma cylindrosporum TaxID=76867 RepID=A0A0C2XDX0_HEBCY|nr:hypothetical protein M413DRAFT_427965 [Hebeloma cylindrosporum h7]
MQFSHHSSNPLEARFSDPLNAAYTRILAQADTEYLSDSDELGKWPKDEYQSHILNTVGEIPSFQSLKQKKAVQQHTPTAGPSRSGASFRSVPQPFVDIDDDMEGEDELAIPFKLEEEMTPRKLRAVEDPAEIQEPEEALPDDDEDIPLAQDNEEDFVDDPDEISFDVDEEMQDAPHQSDSRLGSLSPLTPLSSAQSSPFSSPLSSRPSSPNEYDSLSRRPTEEQEEILHEIRELHRSVPELEYSYELIDRLGTGTFSSVYKAVDLHYDEWDNRPWKGDHPSDSSAFYQSVGPGYKGRGGRASTRPRDDMDVDDERVYVAIKRIYTTSGPERIRNELAIMEKCRGARHASQIITAFRNKDQVVIVLPYQRHMDFRDFYQTLHPDGVKCYFRCLFRALRDIHARGIIHRDVKPANFLYNPFTGIGTLCDFGLASGMELVQQHGHCLHSPRTEQDPHGKNVPLEETQTNHIKQAQRLARNKSGLPSEKVGYLEQDRRPVNKANRAGTRGFRAPEVLLKCTAQTGAIDVWSAGVILLFFLSRKFPIFQSNDDIEGLMEIAVIIGKRKIERAATLHGRTIATNVPDLDQDGISWQEFVERLNPDIWTPRKYDMRFYPHNTKHRDGRALHAQEAEQRHHLRQLEEQQQHAEKYMNPPSVERHSKEMKQAFHLLESILHFESTKRFTPRKALYHPFLEEAGCLEDDSYVPHVPAQGVCSELHEILEDGSHQVRVMNRCSCRKQGGHEDDDDDDEVRRHGHGPGAEDVDDEEWCGVMVYEDIIVEAGQGIAIGDNACEYHRNMAFE